MNNKRTNIFLIIFSYIVIGEAHSSLANFLSTIVSCPQIHKSVNISWSRATWNSMLSSTLGDDAYCICTFSNFRICTHCSNTKDCCNK